MSPTSQQPHLTEAQERTQLLLSTLIRGLHSLVDGPSYIGQLIAYGPKAIPTLAAELLNGKPSGVAQPRQWMVEALGGLRAYDVLLTYLRQPVVIQSAVVRHGEEAVRNTAARELAPYESEEAFAVLLDCLRKRPLPGIVEAIAAYRRKETAPYLTDCLEDDVCRSAAIDALQLLGDEIRPLLIECATMKKPLSPDPESPSSIRRRRCCVRLLTRLPLSGADVSRLAPLVREQDPDLVTAIAKILFDSPHCDDYWSVLVNMLRVQPAVPWWRQDEFRCLLSQVQEKVENKTS